MESPCHEELPLGNGFDLFMVLGFMIGFSALPAHGYGQILSCFGELPFISAQVPIPNHLNWA